jgi:spore maturation protein CgeB
MKVMYVGVEDGTCLSRFKALRNLEPDTRFFAIDGYSEGLGRWGRFYERNAFYGQRARQANADLRDACDEQRPDIIWVDKAVWIWPSTLKALRRRKVFLAHHFTDALFPRDAQTLWAYWLMRRNLPNFNLNFTTNIDDVNHLRRKGVVAVELTHLAFDHERFDDTPLQEDLTRRWTSEVVFIGHHEPRTERFVRGLLAAGIPIRVHGWGWGRKSIAREYPDAIAGGMLSDADYVSAIKGAKIAICCVSEMNYNQTAARSYEIPACGTFLLAMRTPQHLESYVEGREAEFFETPEELVRKARFYLDHDAERKAIARAGNDRCVGDQYTWARYMRDDWARTIDAYGRWKAAGSPTGN